MRRIFPYTVIRCLRNAIGETWAMLKLAEAKPLPNHMRQPVNHKLLAVHIWNASNGGSALR